MRGPLFDGTAARVIAAYCDDAEQAIADEGVNMIRARIASSARHRTGYYESHVQTDRSAGDQLINDHNVVYGPWLEGTSHRNQLTRFKGYHAFRLTAQRLSDRAVSIAERELPPYLRRIS